MNRIVATSHAAVVALRHADVIHISVNWTKFGIHDVTHDIDGAALVAAARSSRSYWDSSG
jgi:hypothetical protein